MASSPSPTGQVGVKLLEELRVAMRQLVASRRSGQGGEGEQEDLAVVFDNSQELDQFVLVIERILQHGLKEKRSFFGAPKGYWDFVSLAAKYDGSAKDVMNNINNLDEGVKTAAGKGRAWIHFALVQKKLAFYLQLLSGKEDLLKEWYEPAALLAHQEHVQMILGTLEMASAINFSLCMKGVDFDNMKPLTTLLIDESSRDSLNQLSDQLQSEMITQKQLSEQLEARQAETVTLKRILAEKEKQIQSLTANNNNTSSSSSSIDNNDASIASLHEDLAIAQQKIEQLREAHQQELATLTATHQAQLDAELASAVEPLNAQLSESLDRIERLELLERESAKQRRLLQDAISLHEAKALDLTSSLAQQSSAAQQLEDLQLRFQQATSTFEAQIAALQSELASEASLHQEHADKVATLQTELAALESQSHDALETRLSEQASQLATTHQNALDAQAASHAVQLAELSASLSQEHEGKLAALQQTHLQELERLASTHAQQEATRSVAFLQLQQEWEQEILAEKELRASGADALTQLEQHHQSELENLKQTAAATMAAALAEADQIARASLDRQLEDARQTHQQEIAALEAQFAERSSELNSEIAALKVTVETLRSGAQSELGAAHAAHAQALAQLQDSLQQQRELAESLQTANGELREKAAALELRVSERAAAEQRLSEELAGLRQASTQHDLELHAAQQSKVAALQQALADRTAELEGNLASYSAQASSLQASVESLQAENASLSSSHATAVEQLRAATEALSSLQSRHRTELDSLQQALNELETVKQQLQTQHVETLASLQASDEKKSQLVATLEEKTAALEEEAAELTAALEKEQSENSDLRRVAEEQQTSHQEAAQRLQRDHEQQLAAQQTIFDERHTQLNAEHAALVASLEEKAAAAETLLRETHQTHTMAVQQLEGALAVKTGDFESVSQQVVDLERQLLEHSSSNADNSTVEAEMATIRENHQQQVTRLNAQHQKEVDRLSEQHRQHVEQLEAQHGAQLEATAAAGEEELRRAQANVTELTAQVQLSKFAAQQAAEALEIAGKEREGLQAAADGAAEEREAWEEEGRRRGEEEQRRAESKEKAFQDLQEVLRGKKSEVAQLKEEAGRLGQAIEGLQEDLEQRQQDLESAEIVARSKAQALARSEERVAALERDLLNYRALEGAEKRLGELQQQSEAHQTAASALEKEAQQLRAALGGAEEELAEARRAGARLQERAEAAEEQAAELGSLRTQLAAKEERIRANERLNDQLLRLQSELEQVKQQSGQALKQAEQDTMRAAELLRASEEKHQKSLKSMAATVQTLTRELKTAKTTLLSTRKPQEAIERFREEYNQLERQLHSLDSMNDDLQLNVRKLELDLQHRDQFILQLTEELSTLKIVQLQMKKYVEDTTQQKEQVESEADALKRRLQSVASASSGQAMLSVHEWVPDDKADFCRQCKEPFGILRRKHHCRNCGDIFCHDCSSRTAILPAIDALNPLRVCDSCLLRLTGVD